MEPIEKVRAGLMKALVDASLGTKLLPENVKADPAGETPFAEVFYMPNPPVPITLGDDGEDEISGYVQLNIKVPFGSGTKEALAACGEVRSAFPVGLNILYDGVVITVKGSGPKPGYRSEAHYVTPFLIHFYSRIQR
jgi:hypothetical protein